MPPVVVPESLLETDAARTTVRTERWERDPLPFQARARSGFLARSARVRSLIEITLHLLAPLVVGAVLCVLLMEWAPALLEAWYLLLVVALLATSLLIAIESVRALKFADPPIRRPLTDEELPRLGVIVPALLDNERHTLIDALHHHLAIDYPADRLVVVCPYNRHERLDVEQELAAWAQSEPRLLVLHVAGSSSKAENVNAALDLLRGHVDVVAIFDADHHPHPTGARMAARWLGDGAGDDRFDVVQGQCAIRNGDDSFVSRTVAAEFATLYAVAHPGRAALHDFGIFGGSNGYWRAEVIDELGLDPTMLTEDIDVTARALLQGRRIASDPRILSSELAPVSWRQLWRQRLRWAQGWWEVTMRHTGDLVRSRALSAQQKRGVLILMVWRVVHPWAATQMWPLMAVLLILGITEQHSWFVPIFVLTTVATVSIPFVQAGFAWWLAPPGLRERRWPYVRFALVTVLVFAEFRAIVNRAAIIRDLLGVDHWAVTPRRRGRSRRPDGAPTAAQAEVA